MGCQLQEGGDSFCDTPGSRMRTSGGNYGGAGAGSSSAAGRTSPWSILSTRCNEWPHGPWVPLHWTRSSRLCMTTCLEWTDPRRRMKWPFFFSQHAGSLFPDQGSNPCSLQRKRRVLTAGPPGNSQMRWPLMCLPALRTVRNFLKTTFFYSKAYSFSKQIC